MIRVLCISILCALAGCEACKRHPTICAVGASIVVSSVITTVSMHAAEKRLEEQASAAESQRP